MAVLGAVLVWVGIGAAVAVGVCLMLPELRASGVLCPLVLSVLGAVVGGLLGTVLGEGVAALLLRPAGLGTTLPALIGAVIGGVLAAVSSRDAL